MNKIHQNILIFQLVVFLKWKTLFNTIIICFNCTISIHISFNFIYKPVSVFDRDGDRVGDSVCVIKESFVGAIDGDIDGSIDGSIDGIMYLSYELPLVLLVNKGPE